MKITHEVKKAFDIALNEATIHGVEFIKEQRTVGCTFGLVSMNEDGKISEDNRLLFILKPIGRIAASLTHKITEKSSETVEKFESDKLFEKVKEFGNQPIYGWDFINSGDEAFEKWSNKLSFDFNYMDKNGLTNTLDLFQEGYGESSIDIRVWFDNIEIFTPSYKSVSIDTFLNNGKRGWDAIYSDDETMTAKYGIVRAAAENFEKLNKIARQEKEKKARAKL
jgi:hypothetical protein